MKITFSSSQRFFFQLSGIVAVLLSGAVEAFPPAPSYTLFGSVRDQTGQAVTAEGATVILLKGGVEVGRTPITAVALDQSYELEMRIDQNRSGTTLYTDKAVESQGPFSLAVLMNGTLFPPIEAAGTLKAGKGGERVRLDLTLGEDKDHDGLPDVWEQWQLYQAGLFPDAEGVWDLSLISKNGDFDHDGQSNYLEYIAGTFAGDAAEKFDLAIREKGQDKVRFEFFAITGKTYTIERTTDAQTWTRVPFSVGAGGTPATSWKASSVGILSAFTVPAAHEPKELYRLTVR